MTTIEKMTLESFSTADIKVAPENDLLYDGFGIAKLDAAPVKLLQSKLRESIQSVIDVSEFNAQCDLERQDAAHIEAHRRVVFDAIQGVQP